MLLACGGGTPQEPPVTESAVYVSSQPCPVSLSLLLGSLPGSCPVVDHAGGLYQAIPRGYTPNRLYPGMRGCLLR